MTGARQDKHGNEGRRGKRPSAGMTPWGQAGMALAIPSLLLAGPLGGYLLGVGLQRWLGWGDWVIGALVLLGSASAVRETIRIIRRLNRTQ